MKRGTAKDDYITDLLPSCKVTALRSARGMRCDELTELLPRN